MNQEGIDPGLVSRSHVAKAFAFTSVGQQPLVVSAIHTQYALALGSPKMFTRRRFLSALEVSRRWSANPPQLSSNAVRQSRVMRRAIGQNGCAYGGRSALLGQGRRPIYLEAAHPPQCGGNERHFSHSGREDLRGGVTQVLMH